jgi:hypothetical protein
MAESEMLRKQVQELRQQLQSSQAQTRAHLQNVAHQAEFFLQPPPRDFQFHQRNFWVGKQFQRVMAQYRRQ